MPAESWQQNFNLMRGLRKELRDKYGFHVTDEGRIAPMRKTARAIRSYNPIQSKYSYGFMNQPITNMIEDIMEKNSSESYFIQICDFVSFFVHLYFLTEIRKASLPNRVANVIDDNFVKRVMATLKISGRINLKANDQEHREMLNAKYPKEFTVRHKIFLTWYYV